MTSRRTSLSFTSGNVRARRSPPAARGRDWVITFLDASIAALLLFIVATAATTFLLYRSTLILPGVHALGVDLQGKSIDEAAPALQAAWDGRSIALDAGETTQPVSPHALGFTLDAEATARDAHRLSRRSATLEATLLEGRRVTVQPVWSLDPSMARGTLQALAPELGVAPVNAGIRVANGHVEATPAQSGRALDVEATMQWLEAHPGQIVAERRLPLVMEPVAPAVTDVSAAVARANQLLASPLTIRAYDPIADEWFQRTPSAEVWRRWFTFELKGTQPATLEWSVHTDAVAAFLNAQTETLGGVRYLDVETAVPAIVDAIRAQQSTVQLRVYHGERRHAVQAGETLASIGRDYGIPYPWIQQANPNLGDSLSVGQEIVLPSPDVLLPLPVVEHKRIIVSLREQRMWAYENGALKWEWPVSTGISSSPTAPGVFQIQSHEPNAYASRWDLWMPNFMGIYRPVPTSNFMNGFHGFPTRNGSTLLWTNDLGHRVTYGCILVSSENAAALYDWAEEGVIVEVR